MNGVSPQPIDEGRSSSPSIIKNHQSAIGNRQALLSLLSLLLVFLLITARVHAEEARSKQTVIFMQDKGPVVMEFELTVGGLAFGEVWRTGLRERLQKLDKDGDGFLSRNETDPPAQPKPRAKPNGPAIAQKATDKKPKKPSTPPLLQMANLWDADAEPRDGKLSLDELAWFLSRRGQGPFQTVASPKTGAMLGPRTVAANGSGQRLWNWLDRDHNTQLSPAELREAGSTLRKYDLDADETISLNELQAGVNPFFSANRNNQNTETPFFAVMPGQSATPLIRRLIGRYAKLNEPKKTKNAKATAPRGLRVETLKIPQDQLARFDRDGNGWLDEFELRDYLKNPIPMVCIQVKLPGHEKGEAQITGTSSGENSSVVVKKSAVGTVSIMVGEMQIEIEAGGAGPESWLQMLKEQFKQIDGDNNGYLEQNEANRNVFFRTHFQEYDADDDGKLYPEEWQPPVTAALRMAATKTRMVVEDAGQDVFTVLDADRNMKISPREWRAVADRMSVWDKNDSGSLDTGEIPHVYRLTSGPGLPDLSGLVNTQNGTPQNSKEQLVKGPKWFQAMDKNGDGDVSAREFLGKPELFPRSTETKTPSSTPKKPQGSRNEIFSSVVFIRR